MSGISRNLNGPYAKGVINPYTTHVHPYPTRFHGPIYTRPVANLPYVRSPHAVFKPDDFYEYYGVKGLGGLGSFAGGSSIGNGNIGGSTLGLGATGTPIYYLASKSNPKVVSLQGGLNKVLNAHGYTQIPVTGKLDALTCAALGLMAGYFKEEVLSQIDGEILQETAKTCNLAQQNSTVKSQVIAQAKNLEANRNKTPAVVLNPQTTTVPPTTSVVVKPATPVDVPTTAPVPTPVVIEQTQMTPEPTPIEFPEMTVEARPEDKSYGSATPWLIGLAVVGGAAYLILRKKK